MCDVDLFSGVEMWTGIRIIMHVCYWRGGRMENVREGEGETDGKIT